MKTEEKLALIKGVLDEMKAEDVVTIDAATRTILADAFVVVTATSDTHARAMGDRMHLALKEKGVRVDHAEVDAGREWTILDFGDIVVHIFLERARRFYNLEELWGKVSAAREKLHENPASGHKAQRGPEREDLEAKPARARKLSPGMERLAEETRAARGKTSGGPTYRSGARPARKPAPKRRD